MARWGWTLALVAALAAAGAVAAEFDFEDGLGAGAWGDGHCARLETAAPISGKRSLMIDTMALGREWAAAWRAPAGLMHGGKSYNVALTARLLDKSADGYLLVLLRPVGARDHRDDAATLEIRDKGDHKLSFRVSVPEKPGGYAVQLHAHQGARALVDDLRIVEAADEFVPADGGPAAPLPGGLPTGAKAFAVQRPDAAKMRVFDAKDFGASPDAADNGPALQAAIAAAARALPARLVLGPGRYRVRGKGLAFDALHDFALDGQGATLVFGGLAIYHRHLIAIRDCERVAFRDFTVDWDWGADPVASMVRAEKVSPDGKTCAFRFLAPENLPPPKNVRVASLTRMAPGTLSPDAASPLAIGLEFFKWQNRPVTRWLEDGLLEVTAARPEFAAVAVGDELRMRHYVYDHCAFAMRSNRDLTLEKVAIAAAPGMGIVVGGEQRSWQFLGVKIAPGPGRCLSTAADAVHVDSSCGDFRMEGCEIAHCADDAVNIHDLNAYAIKLDAHRLRATNARNHPADYFRPGDLIELRRADFSPAGFAARLVETRGARPNLEMVFAEEVPGPEGGGFVVFNRRFGTRNVVIRNNRFHDFSPRGLLLMADDVTVEGNEFVNGEAAGIKLETGYTDNLWSEGFGVNNVVIRDNLFERVNRCGRYPNENRPDIYISSYMHADPSIVKASFPIIQRVLIANNRFVNSTGSPVYVSTAADVVVAGNVFSNPDPCPVADARRGAIGASHAQNLQVLNNRWEGKYGRAGVLYDPETTKGVNCAGNRAAAAPAGAGGK